MRAYASPSSLSGTSPWASYLAEGTVVPDEVARAGHRLVPHDSGPQVTGRRKEDRMVTLGCPWCEAQLELDLVAADEMQCPECLTATLLEPIVGVGLAAAA